MRLDVNLPLNGQITVKHVEHYLFAGRQRLPQPGMGIARGMNDPSVVLMPQGGVTSTSNFPKFPPV